jgi:hypothetical protein
MHLLRIFPLLALATPPLALAAPRLSSAVPATLKARDMTTVNGDGFCAGVSTFNVQSAILRAAVAVTAQAFRDSGYTYARREVLKWTIELTRSDFGFSAMSYIQPAFNTMMDNVIRSTTVVAEHAAVAVGQYGVESGDTGTVITMWITEKTANGGYQVLRRALPANETVPVPSDEDLAVQTGPVLWKGPGKIITESQSGLVAMDASKPYWDSCWDDFWWDGINVDYSVPDCVVNLQDITGLGLTCTACCNGCSRGGNGCCPSPGAC